MKYSLQERICASNPPSTMALTFPRQTSSDLTVHKDGIFSGSVLEAVLVYDGFHPLMGPGADPHLSLMDPLIRCLGGRSGSATVGTSVPCNSRSHVEQWPGIALGRKDALV